ncbi:MAG: nucleotidyltransferase [Thermoanaerobaculia bacterium]|nr:nucleotidyltransferase [Thermoanaerobaculia bacterium]MCZ7652325.1 nucleotidyltransferase [Thermoanaerobaculia bacterium]
MSLLGDVAGLLDREAIPFAVIGAAAMALHGVSRATADIDLLALDRRCLEAGFWRRPPGAPAQVEVRRGDEADPLAGLVRFEAPGERTVDLVVGRSPWQRPLLARAERFSVGELELPVLDPTGLILLKLYAGGPQDAWDIEQLLGGDDRDALVREVDTALAPLPPESHALWRRIARP